ncbi:MAG: hypothetical protein ACJ79A_09925 [Gemmatimonadaceae bacterium]
MAKVKKETGVTGERNGKGKSARGKAHGTKKAARTRPKQRTTTSRKKGAARGGKPVKSASTRGKKAATRSKRAGQRALAVVRGRAAQTPVVHVAVKPLDPLRKCGPKTTVQFLYRVDEQVDGRNTPHLVFFDRHGWYCEHGRSCPAVGHARKFNGQIARVS